MQYIIDIIIDIIVGLAIGACTMLMLPDLWCLVLHACRLAAVTQEWRDSGPHTTLLGKVRERLAAAGLLAAPRDPLVECGVPDGDGWKQFLQLMFLPQDSLACMERQVQLAREEHVAFGTILLVAAACFGLLSVLLLEWACEEHNLVRRHHHPPEDTQDALLPSEGSETEDEENLLPQDADWEDILPEAEEVVDDLPPDADREAMLPEAEEVEDDLPPDADREAVLPEAEAVHVVPPEDQGEGILPHQEDQGHLPAQEAAPEGDAPLQTPADPGREGVQQEGRQETDRQVRRSLHVPAYLRERLEGSEECFLEHLRRCHSVLIFMDPARRRMHVKGAEKNVVGCCAAVKALLAEWRLRDATDAD